MNMHPIKDNKILKKISNILFVLFMISMTGLIFITAQSKITGQEPTLLNHRIYVVDSGSMSPTIKTDSMIIVRELGLDELRVGDIVTYYGHDRSSRITHRAVEISYEENTIVTRGDANNADDPMPLDGSKLIGKVIFTIPLIGKVFRFLNTKLGLGILITLTILWIIVPVIVNKFRKSKKIAV